MGLSDSDRRYLDFEGPGFELGLVEMASLELMVKVNFVVVESKIAFAI